jgi:hypothetical protein
MTHHERKGPKSTRSGCLLCKPQKRQGSPHADRQGFSQTRQLAVTKEKVADTLAGLHAGKVHILGDILAPIDVEWEAER